VEHKPSTFLYLSCAALALLALVGTWGHNISYLPLGLLGANVRFWRDTLVTPASRSITADLFVLALPVFYWMIAEARRLSMRAPWLYVVFSLLAAIGIVLPLFIVQRARAIARHSEPPLEGRLGRADWCGMALLSLLSIGYVAWSFNT
jgi:hypothetical protein